MYPPACSKAHLCINLITLKNVNPGFCLLSLLNVSLGIWLPHQNRCVKVKWEFLCFPAGGYQGTSCNRAVHLALLFKKWHMADHSDCTPTSNCLPTPMIVGCSWFSFYCMNCIGLFPNLEEGNFEEVVHYFDQLGGQNWGMQRVCSTSD